VETLTEAQPPAWQDHRSRLRGRPAGWFLAAVLVLAGCGEPSIRELKNRRELEALLTAISLKNRGELDKDVQRIEDRHASGELSDASYNELREIIRKAQAGDWSGAEKQAYEMRESKPFFQ
jgi:hypothetical protein